VSADHHITRVAAVALRAFELVEEFRWRFDAEHVGFREDIQGHEAPYLRSLVILGQESAGGFMLYITNDVWVGDLLVHARIDAGGDFAEARGFQPLYAKAALKGLEVPLLELHAELATGRYRDGGSTHDQ
jgi:hypothetical protein